MKLLLVDGSALLHRAYHAYPPLTTRQGVTVGAVYGVASMLVSALEEAQPTHVVVAWDLPQPTFRHSLYVAYKAQRPKAEAEMVEQIPLVKDVIESMGLTQVAQAGYEADDVIGTLASNACDNARTNQPTNERTEVVILTGDMDLTQLVSEKIKVLTPPRGRIPAKLYGVQEVREKYGVTPKQIVDFKALIGDPSDNIPGVRGIGPVTAAKLIQEYGDLDAVFAAVNSTIKAQNSKLAEKLIEGRDSAYLSRDLSRIECGMKLEVKEEELEYGGIEREEFREILEQLNFRSLVRRVWKDMNSEQRTMSNENENQMGLF